MIRNELKSLLRRSAPAHKLMFFLRKVEYVRDPAALDTVIDGLGVDGAGPGAEDLLRLSRFCYSIGNRRDGAPPDPFSSGFAEWQKSLYLEVSGRQGYDFGSEATSFGFEKHKNDFFPYNTGSPDFVGEQLMRQGFLIKNLSLPTGSSIVEFGAGWGNTTLQLALMGHRVTAVEMNGDSIELIRHRAAIHGKEIRIAATDMIDFARNTESTFDAALFVASFHHCDDHPELLRHLSRIIRKGGRIYFSEEPVAPAINPALPYAWGLRLDVPSLYYVRKLGWLELGFQESYLREALRRAGWRLARIPSPFPAVSDLYVAEH